MFNVRKDYIYDFMRRNNIPRRNLTESNYLVYKDKPQFKIKDNLTEEEKNLRTAGIILYWSEGTKRGDGIDFVNSDSKMIKVFLEFLRKICGISEERLKVYLYAYSYQDIGKLKKYGSKITQIPLSQFQKPYVRRGNPNLSGRKMVYGLVHIRYSDKRLYELITKWIKEYKETF